MDEKNYYSQYSSNLYGTQNQSNPDASADVKEPSEVQKSDIPQNQQMQNQFEEYYRYRKAQESKNRSKGGLIAAVISICLACLILGGVVGGLILYNVASARSNFENRIIQSEVPIEPQEQPVVTPPEVPKIGGEGFNIPESENKIADICEEMTKSVVGIKGYVRRYQRGVERTAVVKNFGSGIIISTDGYILSNSHVVEECDYYEIILDNGDIVKAQLIGNDPVTDISILKAEGKFDAAPLGNSESLRVGERVIAIGNPTGEQLSSSVTVGYISGLNREMNFNGEVQNMIQTDAAINAGNSGGPLVNMNGEVIGINTLKRIYAGTDEYGNPISSEGLGFAIPINVAKEIAEQIIMEGSVKRPGIGITCDNVTEQDIDTWKVPSGVMVRSVTQNGPADLAGILTYDIITQVNGKSVTTYEELKAEISKSTIGQSIKVTIWREGETIEKSVDIADLNKLR